VLQGSLFTRDWLLEGVKESASWQALNESDVAAARSAIAARLDDLRKRKNPNEAETESKLVWPVVSALGWDHVSVQQNMTVKGRKDVPDGLLFPDASADERSKGLEPWKRFAFASALLEAKRWNRELDREGQGEQGVPSTQLMHYLRRADDITSGAMRWGILTNGRHWRLYWQGALSVAEDFLEIDLGKVFQLPGCDAELFDAQLDRDHVFRLFLLLFGRSAFLPKEQGLSFHATALADARQWEARVARDLSDVVFDRVFPDLVGALAQYDPERPRAPDGRYLEAVRSAALFLLYRLLFVLYAEDRNLLPDESGPYAELSLTQMRRDIEERKRSLKAFAQSSRIFWARLDTIFRAIATGADDLGVPAYNGGLFDPSEAPLLARVQLPDSVIGEVIFLLSHRLEGDRFRYINYRDLSVQQLGSIYESILDYSVELSPEGAVRPVADKEARHRSGSYYTPEDLVSLIIERTVGPLAQERIDAFRDAVSTGLTGDALIALDPATKLLELRVVDPAMGSGHFLVSLVDWLSDKVVTAIEDAAALAGVGYSSPLTQRLALIRAEILAEAKAHQWPVEESQLGDRHLVRRMVLKRCVYGVDLNPMAVELAKVALWLHSFTVGAPLSYLDHHLRCGDSVLGLWVQPTVQALADRSAMSVQGYFSSIASIAGLMQRIEDSPDADITEVKNSKASYGVVEESTAPLHAYLSMVQAETLMGVFDSKPKRVRETAEALIAAKAPQEKIDKARSDALAFERISALQAVLDSSFGNPVRIASGDLVIADPALRAEFDFGGGLGDQVPMQGSLMPMVRPDDRRRLLADKLVREARDIAERRRFLHWEIAFPGVWSNVVSSARSGGFDAVIGNPPYVRQEEISEIKPALKKAYQAFAGTADLYVYFYEQGLKLLRPGGRMGYVVTNKWLKAGYAEGLRRLFAEDAWVEFLADFGHAKRFFPDADVFPSVIVVRKPNETPPPEDFDLVVIPRDDLPRSGLAEVVQRDGYRARRSQLTPDPWTLEPPEVAALMAKIKANGVPLAEYVGLNPLSGLKTGLNQAFIIDDEKKEMLIREHPSASELIFPYVRGQDVKRWWSNLSGKWIILIKSSANHSWPWSASSSEDEAEMIFSNHYPSIHRHMKRFESWIDEKSKLCGLRHREDSGRFWWELRSNRYYNLFEKNYIIYQDIAFHSSFERKSLVIPDMTAFCIPDDDLFLLAILNSSFCWYYMHKNMLHGKDEALRLKTDKVRLIPIPTDGRLKRSEEIVFCVEKLEKLTREIQITRETIIDWLRIEFDLVGFGEEIRKEEFLSVNDFMRSVRKLLPKSRRLSSVDLLLIKEEYNKTMLPSVRTAAKVIDLELRLSDIVNQAYGLTPEDIALVWRTAPPRMPIPPPIGLV
jgi:hypothetical protein